MGKCKQCKGRLEEDFISDYLTMSVDQRPCALCRGTGVIRTGPYRLADGTWSDGVDRTRRLGEYAFNLNNRTRWTVNKGIEGWEAFRADSAWEDNSDPFPTHAEAVAYADRMARTNQGDK